VRVLGLGDRHQLVEVPFHTRIGVLRRDTELVAHAARDADDGEAAPEQVGVAGHQPVGAEAAHRVAAGGDPRRVERVVAGDVGPHLEGVGLGVAHVEAVGPRPFGVMTTEPAPRSPSCDW
jgi:hypothetical protein